MTTITNADLSRLVTHVVIHEGTNPHLLQPGTFERLEKAGLVTAEKSWFLDDNGRPYGEVVDYTVNVDGATVVNAMLAAGRMAIEK
jgi:hypothetical protein